MLLMGAVAAGFTACDDAPAEAIPQYNPEPPILTAADIEIATATAISSGALDLATLTNDMQDSVALLNITKLDNLAPGYRIVPIIEISDTETFEKSGSATCDVRDAVAYASIADLSAAYAAVFGYQDNPQTVYSRVRATAEYESNGTTAIAIVGDKSKYYAPAKFTLTPDLMLKLYVPMSNTDYDTSVAQALQTNDGKNYWGYVNVTGGFYFSNGREGSLARRWDSSGEVVSGDPISIRIEDTGCIWISYNIESANLSTTVISTYGVIGDFPGNNWGTSIPLTQTANPLIWKGDIEFGIGEWKFRANDGWDINLGGTYNELIPGGNNLSSPGTGTHTVTLDLSKIPYSTTITKK